MSLLEPRYAGVPAPKPIPKAARPVTVGVRVRIERDETRYPSKGTWPEFRGCTGTVTARNTG